MHIETERKFLVINDLYKKSAVVSHRIAQGYIAHDGGNTVRIRIHDRTGILTIKGPMLGGMSRQEWEREIALEDAEALLGLCHGGIIDKTRYIVPALPEGDSLCSALLHDPVRVNAPQGESPTRSRCFEVDEFHGENEGLVMAEIELGSEDENFERPVWLGEEVTGDRRYYNSYLSHNPFKYWEKSRGKYVFFKSPSKCKAIIYDFSSKSFLYFQ